MEQSFFLEKIRHVYPNEPTSNLTFFYIEIDNMLKYRYVGCNNTPKVVLVMNGFKIGGSHEDYKITIGGTSIDIRPYFFVALSSDERSRAYIEEKYNLHKWTYFENYQKSTFRNEPLLQCYPIEMEKSIKMVIGIYEEAEESGNFNTLISIVKSSYRTLYRFVEQKSTFDEHAYLQYVNKRKRLVPLNTKDYMLSTFVGMFLCFYFKKNLSLGVSTMESIFGIINSPNTPAKREASWIANTDSVHEKVAHLKKLHQLKKFEEGESLWDYFGNEMVTIENSLKNGESVDNEYVHLFNERLETYIFFGDVLEASGIDPIEVQTSTLTQEDFDMILMEYTYITELYPESELRFNHAFPAIFYIKQLAKMYTKAKVELLDTSEEEKFLAFQEKEKAVAKKEAELIQLEETLKKREAGLKSRLKESEQRIKEMERKEKVLEKELESLRPLKKEVSAVRTLLYKSDDAETFESSGNLSSEKMRKELDKQKIVFFGGHPNWLSKAKEWFPKSRFIEVDDINRKLSFISNYDVVCINTDHFNHAFYGKLMNEVAKQDVQLVYIQRATNEERVIDMLYQGIYE